MQSISQAARAKDVGGQPLPTVWPSLLAAGAQIRGSELAILAGPPAAGKSAFALVTALRMRVPTLYICADTAAWTMAVRTVAALSGMPQDRVEERLSSDPGAVAGALRDASHIRWCFDSAPTLDDIDDEVGAYEEVFGANPRLIVIDNLVDVADGEDEWAAIRRTQKELKFLARETGAAVLVLHHISESERYAPQQGRAPGRSSILGKDTRLPALVLTITNDMGYLGVAVVKNRYGKSDPRGEHPVWFVFDGARMDITETPQEVLA